LNRFAKTHFVSKNTIEILVIHGHEPIETNLLVLTQGAFN
jgi:hypothetical protein